MRFVNQAKLMATVSSISDDKIVHLEDGIKINYCTSGNGDHPVLLLPGALGMYLLCRNNYVLFTVVQNT